ncbi:2'-5' RNA ligase [Psychromonas ingrahamii 37]|uniref:RNA 2',3'-cyclic phosphodiesterase n=1 Tax=Psychromonas ingrahamii (strain DSM 17664 / CCUG 51855 / 37) TaxID=357804 RepID=A1SVM8_PSYIN|nr:RNA 2',3'-cyclic phosphodiesterase [Psychromonas ingrahamii]ABM03543.1 2'-5' RNA ligase [Psychromonas ingrahamii 37]
MTKRLFLGIALDKQQTQQLSKLQANFDSAVRLVPAANLHMTLLFLGLIDDKTQQQLEEQISLMDKPKFNLSLDKLDHWAKPKILCLTGQIDDPALLKLAKNCSALSTQFKLYKDENPFTPHITLARKAKYLPENMSTSVDIQPLLLTPKTLHLFHSQSTIEGVKYQILRSWNLE